MRRCNRSFLPRSFSRSLPYSVGIPRKIRELGAAFCAAGFACSTSIASLRACRPALGVWTSTTRRTPCCTSWSTHKLRCYYSPSTMILFLRVLSYLFRLVELHLSYCNAVPDVHAHEVVEVLEFVNEVLWVVFVSFVRHRVTISRVRVAAT